MKPRLSHQVKALRDGGGMDRELDAEVRFHVEMETEKYIRQGMDPVAARTRAMRNFGPMEKHKEEARDARGVSSFEQLIQDLKYGARTLVKNPGFALLAVMTLGLGIGANTAIFSVINGVLLKPLPYENGDRLVLIQQQTPLARQQNFPVSITELYDYRQQLASFDGIVEFHQMNFDLLRRGEPDRVATGVVSPNFFDVLGIRPVLGRSFVDKDDDEGADAVLILGHAYWQTKFGGDPGIIGQVFEMNDRPHTVVGVLPSVPHYPNEVDVYMPTSACPFRAQAETLVTRNRRPFNVQVFGLLKQDASPETAAAEVATVGERFKRDYPDVYLSTTRLPGEDRERPRATHGRRPPDAVDSARHDGADSVDRVRERRQPHARADAAPRPRARHALGAGRRPVAARPPAAHREHGALGGRRRGRGDLRLVDHRHADHVRRAASRRARTRSRSIPACSASRCSSRFSAASYSGRSRPSRHA